MGVFTALYRDQDFDPPPCGKAQLDQILLSYSMTVAALAQVYKDLGESYHMLPLHIRNHVLYPKMWQEYCSLAFTCSESREMPDMIQVINMITEALARARAAVLCDEYALAVSRLGAVALLVKEAESRVAQLVYAMVGYDGLHKDLEHLFEVPGCYTSFQQAQDGSRLVLQQGQVMKEQWLQALPKCLQEGDKTSDSGYSSSSSSVILE